MNQFWPEHLWPEINWCHTWRPGGREKNNWSCSSDVSSSYLALIPTGVPTWQLDKDLLHVPPRELQDPNRNRGLYVTVEKGSHCRCLSFFSLLIITWCYKVNWWYFMTHSLRLKHANVRTKLDPQKIETDTIVQWKVWQRMFN